MVAQKSEVVAKGNRQFAGSGHLKLADIRGFGGDYIESGW